MRAPASAGIGAVQRRNAMYAKVVHSAGAAVASTLYENAAPNITVMGDTIKLGSSNDVFHIRLTPCGKLANVLPRGLRPCPMA